MLNHIKHWKITVWIVYTLGPKSSTQKYLGKLMGAFESYLHPANSGTWVSVIGEIVHKLTKCLIDRLCLERFKKKSWRPEIPESYKLTEDCITKFVECIKPIAFQAMYSQMNKDTVCKIFKNLSDVRPEMVIPGVIERVYANLDSLTEPHKLTSSLHCFVGIAQALITGHNGYTEYRTHVIPILFATLPGIDPNDIKKTALTLNILMCSSLFIPFVDCSQAFNYYDDLTDEERLLCSQTAEFQDFIFQYLDKILQFINSSSVQSIRMEQLDMENTKTKIESFFENFIYTSVLVICGQCSEEILNAAAKRLTDNFMTTLYEPTVAGGLVGVLLRVFCTIASETTLKIMVPYLIETMQKYINDHPDIETMDKQKDEFLYYLILFTNCVQGSPTEIMKYIDDFLPLLDQLVNFRCIMTTKKIGLTLLGLIGNISSYKVLEYQNVPESYKKPLTEYLPIRHWGEKPRKGDTVNWYKPDERARKYCEIIIHRYLVPILNKLDKHITDEEPQSREELYRYVILISGLIKSSSCLPMWEADHLQLNKSKFRTYKPKIHLGLENFVVNMPDGSNVRLAVIAILTRLQLKVLETSEDDTKTLKGICLVWDLIYQRKHSIGSFESQLKAFPNTKFFQTYKLTENRADLLTFLASRARMQHDLRMEVSVPLFTDVHRQIIINLFQLATSHYSAVRQSAQQKLITILNEYSNAYRCIMDLVTENLQLDPIQNHERFKGTLYILGGLRNFKLIIKNDWESVERLWIGLLKMHLSEKPSIVVLLGTISSTLRNEFPTLAININITDKCVNLALNLANNQSLVTEQEIENGKLEQSEGNISKQAAYYRILETIVQTVTKNSIHWRLNLMASSMLNYLVHPSCKYPDYVMEYALNNLINDSIKERKIALRIVNTIFRQQKRKHLKVPLTGMTDQTKFKPGPRDNNEWAQYDVSRLPKNQQDWDEPRYFNKINGFISWSGDFSVYAPSSEQPKLDRSFDELSDIEKLVYTFFTSVENVDNIIKFWSLEERKGKDKFNRSRLMLIKFLGGAFGDIFVDPLIARISVLIGTTKNTDSFHRCASELIAGLIRGAKHWPYDKTERMYSKLQPIISKALKNISVESDLYWGSCFVASVSHMDPFKQHWLHEQLKLDLFEECSTSFIGCNRIYCLQGTLIQQIWRMDKNNTELFERIKPYLAHPFQNVRERLAKLMVNIFETDYVYPGSNEPRCPRIKNLFDEIMPKLMILLSDPPKPITDGVESMSVDNTDTVSIAEYEEAVRLFKTGECLLILFYVVKVMMKSINRG